MAAGKRQGRIIYEILIILLIGVLLISLYLPRSIWNEEAKNEENCHKRLLNIWTLETYYKNKIKSYTASIDTLIEVIKSDPRLVADLDTAYTLSFLDEGESIETLYHMPIDSVGTCPETMLEYQIAVSDSTPLIKISCPNEESSETIYYIYKKKINNHGSISDGKVSWE